MENADTRKDAVVLDGTVMEELRALQGDGTSGALAGMIDLFLRNAPLRLAALRDAAESGDRARVAWVAHSLKGSSGIFGARGMVCLCEQLHDHANESWPEDGDTSAEDLAAEVAALSAEFDRVAAELAKYR